MRLTREEELMAEGKRGSGLKKCMDILIKFGEAFGAEKMVKIASAHTMPKEPPELLNEMTQDIENVGSFTTLHSLMSAFDPHRWRDMGISEEFAFRELSIHEERKEVYRRLGFYQTYTCLPMLVGNLPRKGDYVSWIGSGAQLLVNSVIGARTNRDGTVINLAAAITGRTPYMGLLMDENRYADVVVNLDGVDPYRLTYTQLGAVGYYVGAKAQNRNIVFDGLPRDLDMTQLKYLMAPLSTSGSVSICHIVGLTPEAPTLKHATGNKKSVEVIKVSEKEIRETKMLYAGAMGDKVDMAIFGCPHCTVPELKAMASFLDGKRIGTNQRLWVGAPYQMYTLAKQMGYTEIIEKAGGVVSSSCMAAVPDAPIPNDVKVIATNSFKAAHYISRLTEGRVRVFIGEMDRCIRAIIDGTWKGESA